MKLFPLLLLPFTAVADGLYTHTVSERDGPMVHQLTQEVWQKTNVVQDEWYGNPRSNIVAMVHTIRGRGISNSFYALNHSALTWFETGGEVSNYWTEVGPIPFRQGSHTQTVVSNRIHSYSQKLGSTQPRLSVKRNGTNVDIYVRVPVKNQFKVLESTNYPPTNWTVLTFGTRALGDQTNFIAEKSIAGSRYGFYQAQTVWPPLFPPPQIGGPFVNVIGKPAWLPNPTDFDPVSVPAGPQMPK